VSVVRIRGVERMNVGFSNPISGQRAQRGKTQIERGRSSLARREEISLSKAKKKRKEGNE
jgi:hypothetical protein